MCTWLTYIEYTWRQFWFTKNTKLFKLGRKFLSFLHSYQFGPNNFVFVFLLINGKFWWHRLASKNCVINYFKLKNKNVSSLIARLKVKLGHCQIGAVLLRLCIKIRSKYWSESVNASTSLKKLSVFKCCFEKKLLVTSARQDVTPFAFIL